MSSTNKTTNYDLSQFVGTDKPAWLTDYNQDMSKIDTGIHTAQSTATGADGKADANTANIGDMTYLSTTAKNTLVAAINEVDSTADSAYNVASNASQTAQGVSTRVSTLENALNLNVINTYQVTFTGNGTLDTNNKELTVATNSDGSICKVYGQILIKNPSNITEIKITGTSLRPSSEFTVKCAGIAQLLTKGIGEALGTNNPDLYINGANLTFKTNGDIIIVSPHTGSFFSNGIFKFIFTPSVIFVKDFGDTPTPPQS